MISFIDNILTVYFTYTTLYTTLFAVASRFYKTESRKEKKDQFPIAILIPVYREDEIILQSVQYIKYQKYPKSLFEVFVIADSLKIRTIKNLKKEGINVLEVNFDKRTKAKSIYHCLHYIKSQGDFEITVILDADNVMHKHFLEHINACYSQGLLAIQGQRVAKNSNNKMAVLDGLSEEINNAIFRKGYQTLGLSSPVIGSGMAFNTELLLSVFDKLDLNSKGEDRELQLEVIKRNHKIYYCQDALVYDEKVDTGQSFGQQRKRWILNQLIYLINSFPTAFRLLLKGNISYFNIAFLAPIQLPRLLNLGFMVIWISFMLIANRDVTLSVSIFSIYLLSHLLVVPREYFKKSTLYALASLPKTFGIMLLSLLTAHQANKQFLHTTHSTKHEIKL
jgi:cellulose synthase/poly-beta-1,6-N-acetylglucosamine synthase-like glycosyltransferase